MADISAAIARTLRRLADHPAALTGQAWLPAIFNGLAGEFNRVVDFKNFVLSAAVPNDAIPTDALDDLEAKYGINNFLGVTTAYRIARVMERAYNQGSGGSGWLQDRIQEAGFPLYVIENTPQPATAIQFDSPTPQFSPAIQFGQVTSRIDPGTVYGELIVSSPPKKLGTVYTTQYGVATQYGTVEYGTVDPSYSRPQPVQFSIPTDATKWGFFFFLSPTEGAIVTDPDDLYPVTPEEFRYLKRLIIQSKFLRNWCIAQVAVTE